MPDRHVPVRFHYEPIGAPAEGPHVMVDGAARPSTALTLSHWPGSSTPRELWHDLSAGIVMAALARPACLPAGVSAATIDHYDADGVIALALLCVDGLADGHGPLLVEAARVGDFDVVTDHRAALVAFALGALAGPSPLPGVHGGAGTASGGGVLERCARAATSALEVLPSLVAEPLRFEELWGDEARAYERSVAGRAEGWIRIEERPGLDLAVVTVDGAEAAAGGAGWAGAPVHPAAVHSATSCLRILTVAGGHLELRYRYESWVRLVSRRPRPRVDLSAAAAELTAMETGAVRWRFDGAGALTAALRRVGGAPSSLDPGRFVDVVVRHLAALDDGPPAWDPWAVPVRSGRGSLS